MSKYSYIVDGRLKTDKEILTHIANELAEANRLKRLELELDPTDSYSHLEDKA